MIAHVIGSIFVIHDLDNISLPCCAEIVGNRTLTIEIFFIQAVPLSSASGSFATDPAGSRRRDGIKKQNRFERDKKSVGMLLADAATLSPQQIQGEHR